MQIHLLYIAAGLVLAIALMFRLFRCAHAWEFIDKTKLPSKLEVVKANFNPQQMRETALLDAAKVKATIVVKCNRCGACKIIRMSN